MRQRARYGAVLSSVTRHFVPGYGLAPLRGFRAARLLCALCDEVRMGHEWSDEAVAGVEVRGGRKEKAVCGEQTA